MEKLAETFGAPVIEGYGMTEATHQMCVEPAAAAGAEAGPWACPQGR
jgi:acyl-CoA synthetase (AMP-forming)/AMP-acid ligase II